jgi:hypothetical protein
MSKFEHGYSSLMVEKNVIRGYKKVIPAALLAGLFVNLSACKGSNDQRGIELKDSGQATAANQNIMDAPMNLNRQIEFAKTDLAARLNVPLETVALSAARRVNWRSGALGCPKPGMNYTDALVPGAQIFLQVNNMIHAYHAKFDGKPFYCPRERVEQPVIEDSSDLT